MRFQVAEQKLEAVVQVRSVGSIQNCGETALREPQPLLPSNMTLLQMFTGKCLRLAQFERRTFDCWTRKLVGSCLQLLMRTAWEIQ